MSDKRVDLSLMVPDYLWENGRFRRFLEILEENLTEVLDNLDDINKLYNLETLEEAKDWVNSLLRMLGLDYGLELDQVQRIVDVGVDWLRRKGSFDAYKFFIEQIFGGKVISFEDNFEKVLVLSERGSLSGGYLQDSKFYRDGSWSASMPYFLLEEKNIEIIKKLVPVGIFVWFFVFVFVFDLYAKLSINTVFQYHQSILNEIEGDSFVYEENIRSMEFNNYSYVISQIETNSGNFDGVGLLSSDAAIGSEWSVISESNFVSNMKVEEVRSDDLKVYIYNEQDWKYGRLVLNKNVIILFESLNFVINEDTVMLMQ